MRGSEDTICSAEPQAGPASVTIQVSGEQRSCETENTVNICLSGLLKWFDIEGTNLEKVTETVNETEILCLH